MARFHVRRFASPGAKIKVIMIAVQIASNLPIRFTPFPFIFL